MIFYEGDVYSYTPTDGDGGYVHHCREGMAIATKGHWLPTNSVRLIDTFWATNSIDDHMLTEAEMETATFLFNVNQYRELDHHEQYRWEEYAPDDREVITSQHGLQKRYFVRKGAEPDPDTIIWNAREKVLRAKDDLVSAQRSYEWAKEELARTIKEFNKELA